MAVYSLFSHHAFKGSDELIDINEITIKDFFENLFNKTKKFE